MLPLPGRKSFHGKPCPYCRRAMDLNDFHLNPTKAERRQRNKEQRRRYGQPNVHGNVISFRRERQGSPPPAPVIVPPELIYGSAAG